MVTSVPEEFVEEIKKESILSRDALFVAEVIAESFRHRLRRRMTSESPVTQVVQINGEQNVPNRVLKRTERRVVVCLSAKCCT